MSSLKYLMCLLITLIHNRGIYIRAEDQGLCHDDVVGSSEHNYLVNLHIIDVYGMDHDFDRYIPDRTHFCSGSIIDKNWIISAAHCFVDDDDANEVTIMSAQDRILGFSNEIVIHPDFIPDPKFNYYNGQNDLALVKTKKPIQMNAFTQSIGLARLGAFGSRGIVIAYEDYQYSTMKSPLENVVVVNQCACAPNDSFILCAHSETYVGSPAAGAALKTDDGLIGIMSETEWSSASEQYYIVDISYHLDWIQEVTKKYL